MDSNTIWTTEAHAKINLGLQILDRRPDGYHEIETAFVYIDWRDTLRFKRADNTRLMVEGLDIPNNEDNLVNKAIAALRNFGLKGHFHIHLQKRIPLGAGLGGGSSDAAATLRLLAKIEALNISESDLLEAASSIGADVPFFLTDQPAIGRGLGTDLSPKDCQPDAWILTVYPNEHSNTAEAYRYCTPRDDHEFDVEQILDEFEYDEWQIFLQNDLEASVIPRISQVGHLKDELLQWGAYYASMSGSGSAVYGLFDQEFVAQDAMKSLLTLGYKCNLTSPLFRPDLGIYQLET